MPTTDTANYRALTAVRSLHTLIWLVVEACMVDLIVSGLRGKTDRRARLAGAVVAGEAVVFAANGFRCPLTGLAERLGSESGSVTDIYLPRWCARSLPAIHVPAIATAAVLHWRNLRRTAV